jgi:hypothetical protein
MLLAPDVDVRMELWWNNNLQGKSEVVEGKATCISLCPPHISYTDCTEI